MTELVDENATYPTERRVTARGALLRYPIDTANIEHYLETVVLATVLVPAFHGEAAEPMLVMRSRRLTDDHARTLMAVNGNESPSFHSARLTLDSEMEYLVATGAVVVADDRLELPRPQRHKLVDASKLGSLVRFELTEAGDVMVSDLSGKGVAVTALWDEPELPGPPELDGAKIIDFPPQSTSEMLD